MVGPGASAVTLRHAAACLHFDADDTTVATLEDEVDLVAVTGSPMTDIDRVVEPGDLLDDLADDQRFEEMSEFGECCRIQACEPVRCQTEQARGDAAVENVQLRSGRRTGSQRAAPGRESPEEEEVFEKTVAKFGICQALYRDLPGCYSESASLKTDIGRLAALRRGSSAPNTRISHSAPPTPS